MKTLKLRTDEEFAEDMRKYTKEELIKKMVNMRSFLLELTEPLD